MSRSSCVRATLAATLAWSNAALAGGADAVIDAPPAKVVHAAVSPDARRYSPAPTFAHWAGAERTLEGELAPVTPRPLGDGLLPALADEPQTSAFARGIYAHGPNPTWRLLELASMHEIEGGPVLSANFRVDERETRAVQGALALTLPLGEFWLVPLVELGAGSIAAPRLRFGNEVRSSRRADIGYSFGFEGSEWTLGRRRMLGKLGVITRISPNVVLEQRLLVGVWLGPEVDDDLAFQSISAATQLLSDRFSLYERATVARGAPSPTTATTGAESGAWSLDASVGVHYAVDEAWGAVLAADVGWQPRYYTRVGMELTLYARMF